MPQNLPGVEELNVYPYVFWFLKNGITSFLFLVNELAILSILKLLAAFAFFVVFSVKSQIKIAGIALKCKRANGRDS